MPGRDVVVTVKTKDTDLDRTEVKLQRLKKAANDVGSGGSNSGLTQQEKLARFMGKDLPDAASKATSELQETAAATSETGEAAAAAGINIGVMAAAAAAAIVVLIALVAITKKVAEHIYADVQAFAKFGLEVGKMADDTGLAAETVSALNAELEAQDRSFNDLKAPIDSFRKTIGQAAAGSEDARRKLQQLGIDGSKALYDIDAAFKKAIATIVRTTNPLEQNRLGFAAFGSEWVKLQPIVRDFPGDIDAVIRKAQELGIVMTGKDVAAAKEFNRTYSELQNLLKGIKDELGREFLPVVRDVIRELSNFITKNREGIIGLAEMFGNAAIRIVQTFEAIAKWIDEHPTLVGLLGRFFDYATSGNISGLPTAVNPIPRQPTGPKLYDYSRPQDIPQGGPDLAALDALRAQQEKQLQEAIERNKKDWDAAIKLWENSGNEAGATLSRIFSGLKDKLEKDGNIGDFIKGVNAATSGYLNTINQVYTQLEQLEDERARRNKATDAELQLLQQEQLKRRQDWAQKAYDIQNQADNLVTTSQKKATEQQLADYKAGLDRKNELDSARSAAQIANFKILFDERRKSEQEYIDFVNTTENGDLQNRLKRAQDYLSKVRGNKEKEADAEQQVKLIKQRIAEADAKRTDDAILRARKLQAEYDSIKESLQDQLDELERGGRPLTEYEKTLKLINTDLKDRSEAEKQVLLDIAAQIDAVKELQAEYAKVKGELQQIFDYALRGDFKGLGRALLDNARNAISDKLSGLLATVITGYDPNSTNNPIAKPIVGEIKTTNKLLSQLVKATGQSPAVAGLGSLGGLIASINGGGLGGLGGGIFGGIGGDHGTPGGNAQTGGGSILDRLGQIFGTGPGGIFAPPTTRGPGSSRLSGYLSGIGQLAGIAGGFVGGRFGSALSGAGLGLQIGAAFGPVGAAIGAAGGFLIGLLGFSDPKRKQDKQQNIPALQKGFTDAISQLNKILDDIRHLNIDPDDAINQATAIRADIAGGFGIQFLSKKYRKQAQQMISSQLVTADSIIAQIRASAEIARGAADRSKRILPEFATGWYFADYFRPNGLIPGIFDGKDNILSLLTRGELVLNPDQRNAAIRAAGFDVFAHAGIPNYPQASSSPKLAIGGIAGAGLTLAQPPADQPINITIVLQGDTFDDKSEAFINSDRGKRAQITVIKKLKKDGDIS